MPNYSIGVNFSGNLGNLPNQAAQAAESLGNVGTAANTASAGLNRLPPAAAPAGRGLSLVGKDAIGAASALNRIPPAAGPAVTGLNNTTTASNNAAAALAKLRGSSGQASGALIDVGRVIQDAPFGFVGIANNITALTESFGRLRTASGSTGGALKALGGSLLGPGGLGIALSLVTTALTFATVGFGAWTRGFGGAKSKIDEHNKALAEMVDNLKSVQQVTAEATGSVQGQIANVQALAGAVQNTNLSYEQRKRALQELQQVNKAYFGDLTLEANSLSKLASKVDEYTKALVANAVVKGFTDEISKVSVELAKQTIVTDKARTRLNQLRKELEATPRLQSNVQGVVSQSGAYTKLADAVGEASKQFNIERDAQEKLAGNQAVLTDQLKKATVAALEFADTSKTKTEGHKKEDEILKSLRKELEGYQSQLDKMNKLREKGKLAIFKENDALELQLKIFDTLKKIDDREVLLKVRPKPEIDQELTELEIEVAFEKLAKESVSEITVPLIIRAKPIIETNRFSPAALLGNQPFIGQDFEPIDRYKESVLDKIEKAREDLTKSIQKLKIDAKVQAVEQLGASLGQLISGDSFGEVLANAAEGFLGIIGNVLSEIGKQIILTSTLIESLKQALSGILGPGGTAVAIGVGFALVGLGALLKNIQIPAFASGVTNFSGGTALVGERGPELVNLPQGANVIPNHLLGVGAAGVQVYGVLRGEDLYLSNRAVTARRARM